jgi:hypothetical protein
VLQFIKVDKRTHRTSRATRWKEKVEIYYLYPDLQGLLISQTSKIRLEEDAEDSAAECMHHWLCRPWLTAVVFSFVAVINTFSPTPPPVVFTSSIQLDSLCNCYFLWKCQARDRLVTLANNIVAAVAPRLSV